MCERIILFRLTDKSTSELLGDGNKPFVLLFESRYDSNTGKMIDALRSALEHSELDIAGGICMVEESPVLCRRFNVLGVPTIVAGLGDTQVGESLGLRTEDELTVLIKKWFSSRTERGDN